MGIKIYSVEKMQRVLTSVLDDGAHSGHETRGRAHTGRHQEDLKEVLRNEKLAASEREPPMLSLAAFKGPYIYIHDMDERYRPTMLREYAKPAKREEGEWPQFRSAGVGKCPFVEDPNMRRDAEHDERKARRAAVQREQQRQAQQKREQAVQPRGMATNVAASFQAPRRISPRRPLQATVNTANNATIYDAENSVRQDVIKHENQPSFPPMPSRDFDFVRPPKFQMPREPAASGIQRSNLTSAIQSQVISSTAATAIKAGTSKEVHHQLKRQVLERTHTGSLSVGSIPSSHRMTDLAGALKTARAPAPQRAAKSKAQEKLGGIQEEDPYADDIAAERAASASRKKKTIKRDPKPGYCENCRDKYEDFDEVRGTLSWIIDR
jgi:regulatory subunit for Cdc7p protein kinase